MRPAMLAVLAVIIYAILNLILEQKLSKYTTSVLLLCFYAVMIPLATAQLLYLKATEQPIALPTGKIIWLILLTGAMYFLADFFYVNAYSKGGSLITVTTIIVSMPVFASIVKYVYNGSLPNSFQTAGYILVALGILLTVRGNIATG